MNNKFKLFSILFLAAIIAFSYISPFVKTSEKISGEVFRLHILANSDSEEDQALKLKVRNAVLACGEPLFKNCRSLGEAVEIGRENTELFKNAAQKCVSDNGYDYLVNVYVDKEYFNTRKYNQITMPGGIYNALKIEIGQAKGHNWWCVMFPAICLPSVSEDEINQYLSDDEVELLNSGSKYKIRFKIVEIYEKLKSRAVTSSLA